MSKTPSNPNTRQVLYGLVDPITHDLRYVGISDNPRRRLTMHMQGHHPQPPVWAWLSTLKKRGLLPDIIEFGRYKSAIAQVRERELIGLLAPGGLLLNVQHNPLQQPNPSEWTS
jgi:hypothetical protein